MNWFQVKDQKHGCKRLPILFGFFPRLSKLWRQKLVEGREGLASLIEGEPVLLKFSLVMSLQFFLDNGADSLRHVDDLMSLEVEQLSSILVAQMMKFLQVAMQIHSRIFLFFCLEKFVSVKNFGVFGSQNHHKILN